MSAMKKTNQSNPRALRRVGPADGSFCIGPVTIYVQRVRFVRPPPYPPPLPPPLPPPPAGGGVGGGVGGGGGGGVGGGMSPLITGRGVCAGGAVCAHSTALPQRYRAPCPHTQPPRAPPR